jgi:putative transposase
MIRIVDNGPKYRGFALASWAQKHKIKLLFIERGKPTQNSYIKWFNCTYLTEVLNAFLFESIEQMWDETEKFQYNYNNFRPHGS